MLGTRDSILEDISMCIPTDRAPFNPHAFFKHTPIYIYIWVTVLLSLVSFFFTPVLNSNVRRDRTPSFVNPFTRYVVFLAF